jgi:hypothetical protein
MSLPGNAAAGTEAEMVALQVIIDKALDYPRKGVRIGGGAHPLMPDTWDGIGDAPFGWTRTATVPWLNGPTDAVLPLPDDLAAQTQGGPAQGRLTGLERAALASAIGSRGSTILDGRTQRIG